MATAYHGGGGAAKCLNHRHVRRPPRHSKRGHPLQRGQGDLCAEGLGQAGPGGGRGGDPRRREVAPGASRRVPDARCPRRRSLCRQGAGAEEPGHPIYPGRAPAEAAAPHDLADPLHADRHHAQRGRGAVARGAADQALPPTLQRPSARRQKLPLHPAARGSRLSARPAPPRRSALQGAILRAVRERRLGPQHA